MISRRPAPRAAAPAKHDCSGYLGLLRAAEAHPDEVFTIAGDKLALMLRQLEAPRRRRRRLDSDS